MKLPALMVHSYRKHVNVTISLLLAAVLLLSVGCGKKTIKTDDPDTSSPPATASENNSSLPEIIDPLSGTITAQTTVKKQRSDAKEVIPTGNCASLLNPLKGYADNEADSRRNTILSTGNTEQYYKITGKKYYFSANGNDNNSGLSPSQPLRSISLVSSLTLGAGDAVLFERGSIFRNTQTIMGVTGVTYGSYGKGNKPAIYGSPINYATDNIWQPTAKKNVWKADFPYNQAGSIVFEHGKEVGFKKSAGLDQLTSNTDFYHNREEGIIYLYCDKGNPSNAYSDIEICADMRIFALSNEVSDVTIDNLCLKYSGDCAVAGLENNNNITITNCEIGFIGGIEFGVVRYGNAITVWNGCGKFNVSNNWIYQSFDTAISPQGSAGNDFTSITFLNNLLEYNSVDFEWYDLSTGKTAKWSNFRCEGNIMRFTCLGWGNRPNDAGIRGIEGCVRGMTRNFDFSGFSFKDNIFDCPGREIVNWSISDEQLSSVDFANNTLYFNKTYRKVFNSNPVVMRYLNLKNMNQYYNIDVNAAVLEELWRLWDKSPSSKAYFYE